jgi:hypothetical protein
VARFEAAGLIPLGKTNVSEFGLLPLTEPKLYDHARNPWNLDQRWYRTSSPIAVSFIGDFSDARLGARGIASPAGIRKSTHLLTHATQQIGVHSNTSSASGSAINSRLVGIR